MHHTWHISCEEDAETSGETSRVIQRKTLCSKNNPLTISPSISHNDPSGYTDTRIHRGLCINWALGSIWLREGDRRSLCPRPPNFVWRKLVLLVMERCAARTGPDFSAVAQLWFRQRNLLATTWLFSLTLATDPSPALGPRNLFLRPGEELGFFLMLPTISPHVWLFRIGTEPALSQSSFHDGELVSPDDVLTLLPIGHSIEIRDLGFVGTVSMRWRFCKTFPSVLRWVGLFHMWLWLRQSAANNAAVGDSSPTGS